MKFNPSGARVYSQKNLSASATSGTYFFRFYFLYSTRPNSVSALLDLRNSSAGTVIQIQYDNTTSKLRVYNAVTTTAVSSSASISADAWYRVEVRYLLSDTVGQVEARLWYGANLDGVTADEVFGIGVFTGGNQTDEDTLSTNLLEVCFGARGATNTTCTGYIDDVAFNDTSGSIQTSWPGTGKIALIKPDGDVAVAWTKVGGLATNTDGVDDVPGTPSDTEYNLDLQATNVDRLSLTALPAEVAAGDTMVLLDVYGRVGSDSTSGTPQLKFRVWNESAASSDGPVVSCDISGWRVCATNEHFVYDLSGKTKANVADFNVGYIGNAADGENKYISALWANVEWQTAAAPAGDALPMAMNHYRRWRSN